MMRSSNASLLILLAAGLAAAPQSYSQARTPLSCHQAVATKAGVGVAYDRDLSIDDYKLSARIPDGLTGWGGVAADAPFHGFTIFLDPGMRSCIVFEIHLRIDDDEVPVRPHAARSLSLGDANGWQVSIANRARAKGLVNVATYFSFKQDGQIDDGKILLISRPEELQKARAVYDTFLQSVMFGTRHHPISQGSF